MTIGEVEAIYVLLAIMGGFVIWKAGHPNKK
jgi:hypothetical protein